MSDEKRGTPHQPEQPFDPADFNDADPLALDEGTEAGTDTGAEGGTPELDALIAERDELKDRLMRALADVENTRKRGERDRRDAEIYGGAKLARDLLSVYDNLKRALETVDEQQREMMKGLIEGIELTQRELLNTFARHGIERIAPETGEKFDPNIHQAMFEAPVPGIEPGNVIQLMNEGFRMRDRLLRPAQVGVSSAAPAEAPAQNKAAAQD